MVFGWPGFFRRQGALAASYVVAAFAMLATVFYLFLRLRAYVSTTYMLVVALLLISTVRRWIHTLTSDRTHFLFSWAILWGRRRPRMKSSVATLMRS
jgi:hypothetical protein